MKFIIQFFTLLLLTIGSCKAQNISKEKKVNKIIKTDAQWKKELTAEQYYILREAGTEKPFSSILNNNKKAGVYVCIACKTPLYLSENKFNSSKKMILFCALGMRSALATKSLDEMGFKNVAHVKGGFDALKQSGFEIAVKEKK